MCILLRPPDCSGLSSPWPKLHLLLFTLKILKEALPEQVTCVGDELQSSCARMVPCGKEGESFEDCQAVKWILLDHGRVASCPAWHPWASCQGSGETGDISWALPASAGPVAWSMPPCLILSTAKSSLLASKAPLSVVFLRCQTLGWSSSEPGYLLCVDLAAGEGEVCCVRDRAYAEANGFCIPAGSLGSPLRLSQLVLRCSEPLPVLHEWYTRHRHCRFLARGADVSAG